MIINNQKVNGIGFAYDGCHKIYILESEEDVNEAREIGYEIHPLRLIKSKYNFSCDLRFISDWKLKKRYVSQFEKAIFKGVE